MKIETNNNLWFQPYSFDKDKFTINDLQVVKKSAYDPLNVIRWRNVLNEFNQPEIDAQTKKVKTESNCRLMKWEDGT